MDERTKTIDSIVRNKGGEWAAVHAAYDAGVAAERERLCAAIKAEDDYCVTEGGYMLDSDDCISVIRGTWVRPEYNPGPNGPNERAPAGC